MLSTLCTVTSFVLTTPIGLWFLACLRCFRVFGIFASLRASWTFSLVRDGLPSPMIARTSTSISVGEYSVAGVFPALIHIGELFSILYAASPTIPMSFRMVQTLDSQEPGPVINCTEQIPRFSIREHTSTDPRIAFPKPHNCIPCKWEYWCLYCNSALSYLPLSFNCMYTFSP